MKNLYKLIIVAAVFFTAAPLMSMKLLAAEKIKKIILAGPFATVSNPLIRMVETGALSDVADQVEFKIWKTPDQMRALALNGETDFIAVPTNVAANLYNRGADIKLLNVSIWGILWMVSRDNELKTLADFKGKEIAIPFRGDMPDIVFQELVARQGLDAKKDFKLRYVASPLDAMQLLITRRIDHALLIEPAISMALRKIKTFPTKIIAPDLYRSVDLQKEWGRLFKREALIPQAGVAVINKDLPDHVIKRFMEEHEKAVKWCNDHPLETGKMVADRVDMLTKEAVADSMKVSRFKHVTAGDAKKELEYFFKILHARTPALIGGKLPDDNFYYQYKGDTK